MQKPEELNLAPGNAGVGSFEERTFFQLLLFPEVEDVVAGDVDVAFV